MVQVNPQRGTYWGFINRLQWRTCMIIVSAINRKNGPVTDITPSLPMVGSAQVLCDKTCAILNVAGAAVGYMAVFVMSSSGFSFFQREKILLARLYTEADLRLCEQDEDIQTEMQNKENAEEFSICLKHFA